MRACLVAVGLLVLATASPARGQGVTGRVTSDGVPLPGVVVSTLDQQGTSLARALTRNDGRYLLPADARAVSLRATRIGYRPATIRLTGTDVPDVLLVRLPTMLAAVRVSDQPGCPRRSDRAEAFALWEQARAALLSTVVARETDDVSLDRLHFYRIVGEKRAGVLTQIVRRDTGGSRPFGAARSARQFIEQGFQDANTGTFFAPDADVLLDEWFTRGYCIRLAGRERERPRQVGIRFEPAARKRGRIDINGTVWVDTSVRALSDVEFRYVGLDTLRMALALGGEVVFTTLPKGYPVVTRWAMRIDAPGARMAWGVDGRQEARPAALEVHELGGELARASWRDTTWVAPLGHVSGRLFRDSLPVPDATLRLIGTPYTARTDSAGNFAIAELIPGRYTFAVPDAELNALGFELTRGQSFESVRDAARVDVVRPEAADFLAVKCRTSRRDTMTSMIAGRVFANGDPAPQVRVNLLKALEPAAEGTAPKQLVVYPRAGIAGVDTSVISWERIHHDFTGAQSMFYLASDGADGASGAFFICKPPAAALLRIDAVPDSVRGSSRLMTNVPGKRVYPVRVDLRSPR